ncbi:MAG: hypothetical protein NPIRA05_14890 [Nitrospirales bacterium]|nr:MAG: hypothetical protein NPIRA05_14890 [Nitrospirales bacterium]
MPRLSELIRIPSTTAVLPKSFLELEYFSGTKEQLAFPSLGTPNHVFVTHDGPAHNECTLVELVDEAFAGIVEQVSHERLISLEGMRSIAVRIAQDLHRSEQLVSQVFSEKYSAPRIVSNALNVAVLSTKMGMGLSYANKELIDLALAALLHDIGKFLLPEALVDSTEMSEADNEKLFKRHPELGYNILKKLSSEPWLAEVVWQEHERWGGQGYPKGLKGEEIHQYAQIIGLADRFETMVNDEGLSSHDAIRLLLTNEKLNFHGQLLKVLVQQISLFPVGTVVRLTTGEVGTVEKTNPQHPLRPVLRMNRSGNSQTDSSLSLRDLSQDTLTHIKEVMKDHQG